MIFVNIPTRKFCISVSNLDAHRVCAALNNTVETFDQAKALLSGLGPIVLAALEKATNKEKQGESGGGEFVGGSLRYK